MVDDAHSDRPPWHPMVRPARHGFFSRVKKAVTVASDECTQLARLMAGSSCRYLAILQEAQSCLGIHYTLRARHGAHRERAYR